MYVWMGFRADFGENWKYMSLIEFKCTATLTEHFHTHTWKHFKSRRARNLQSSFASFYLSLVNRLQNAAHNEMHGNIEKLFVSLESIDFYSRLCASLARAAFATNISKMKLIKFIHGTSVSCVRLKWQ